MDERRDSNSILNKCKLKGSCGSCSVDYLSYSDSLNKKNIYISKLLSGKVEVIENTIACKNPTNYRNKVHAAFSRDRQGKIHVGLYEESTHKIVECDNCLLQDSRANVIIKDIKKLAISWKVDIYNERTRTGVLRRVLVRTSDEEIMLVLVLGQFAFPGKRGFIKELLKLHPEITTVLTNINNRSDSMILGAKTNVEYGRGFIFDKLLDNRYKLSPESFYQINKKQAEVLYTKASEFAQLRSTDRVIDAYCGIGTIGLSLSDKVKEVIGIELNKEAYKDAKNNASINEISNARFICDDSTRVMMSMAREHERIDVVILDPPRSGTTEEFIRACGALEPRTIVYVSCDPNTLARDLDGFARIGYKALKAVPVDMFPWTKHVETVVQMVRKKPDAYVDLKIDMNELDLTASEA